MLKTFKVSLIALLLVGAIFLLLPAKSASAQALQPSHAHHALQANNVTCTGDNNSCNGQNPYTTDIPQGGAVCAQGSYIVLNRTVQIPYGVVYLMYSPYCKTNWSEVDVNTNAIPGTVLANANVTRSDGLHYSTTIYSNGGYFDSPMVYAPTLTANACGSINNQRGGCTGYL